MRLRIGDVWIEVTDEQADDLRAQLGIGETVGRARQSGFTPPGKSRDGALSAGEVAARIGMSVEYVRDHARELGGEKHGNKWRFNPAKLEAPETSGDSSEVSSRPRRRPRRKASGSALLEIRGRSPYDSAPKRKAVPGDVAAPAEDLRQRRQ